MYSDSITVHYSPVNCIYCYWEMSTVTMLLIMCSIVYWGEWVIVICNAYVCQHCENFSCAKLFGNTHIHTERVVNTVCMYILQDS